MRIDLTDVIEKAREYDRTKSITTAVDCAKMLNEWADTFLVKEADDEQD